MKNFNVSSFGIGFASGMIVLALIASGHRLLYGANPITMPMNNGTRQFQGGTGGPGGVQNTARMATRFGMTESELQAELNSGKTMQEIATEHGVTFGGGRRTGSQNGNEAATNSVDTNTSTASVGGTTSSVIHTSSSL